MQNEDHYLTSCRYSQLQYRLREWGYQRFSRKRPPPSYVTQPGVQQPIQQQPLPDYNTLVYPTQMGNQLQTGNQAETYPSNYPHQTPQQQNMQGYGNTSLEQPSVAEQSLQQLDPLLQNPSCSYSQLQNQSDTENQ